jgi:ABC-type dipeptide/oligopeptide/nickel transport system permease component
MQQYIFRRLLQGVLVLVLLAVIVFALGRATGDPVSLMLPEDATKEDRARLREILKLDKPYPVQFYTFIRGAITGDFGKSIRYGEPALDLFFQRLPNTLKLLPLSIAIGLAMAIPLGVISAVHRGTMIDKISTVIAVFGLAAPSFWVGIVLIYIFSVQFQLLPSAMMGGPKHYVLPAVTLGIGLVAGMTRLVRSSMLEVLDTEFVKLARIKGLSERVVVWKHCLRNALIPVLTLAGIYLALLITGAIVVETVFAWPGVGRLAYEAVIGRDYPLLQTVILLKAVIILAINLGVDISYAYVDPRIRYT